MRELRNGQVESIEEKIQGERDRGGFVKVQVPSQSKGFCESTPKQRPQINVLETTEPPIKMMYIIPG